MPYRLNNNSGNRYDFLRNGSAYPTYPDYQSPYTTQYPVSAVGTPGYSNYALQWPGDSGLGLNGNSGLNLDSMGGGQGLVPTTDSWWGNSNSFLGGKGGGASNSGIGWNLNTINAGMNGLAAIGGLYGAFQSNKLAKKQFEFTKEVTNTNLNNQIKTYNTSLEDRARARGRLNGVDDPEAYARDYVAKNQLTRSK